MKLVRIKTICSRTLNVNYNGQKNFLLWPPFSIILNYPTAIWTDMIVAIEDISFKKFCDVCCTVSDKKHYVV